MPLFDYECETASCGRIFERLLSMAARVTPQPCPDCQGPTHRIWLPSGVNASHFQPVILFKKPDGTFAYPGSSDTPTPHGCERVELRTFADIDQHTRHVNQIERSKIAREVERDHQHLEATEAHHRPDLRAAMQRMSPRDRAFAELAIAKNNATRPRTRDPNFYLEMREMNASNREGYRDAGTGLRGRK